MPSKSKRNEARVGVELKTQGRFQSGNRVWSSHFVFVKFVVVIDTTDDTVKKCYIVKKYGQASKNNNGTPQWTSPFVKRKELKKLQAKAEDTAKDILARRNKSTPLPSMTLKEVPKERTDPHDQEHCERCHAQVISCTGMIQPLVNGPIYQVDKREYRQWKKDILKSKSTTLYHQTDRDAANAILRSQQMLKGSGGSLGAGIYFAETPEATTAKARKNGVILKCEVKLGKQLSVKAGSQNTFKSVREGVRGQDYDSVVCTQFNSGTEYVVFDSVQVVKISEYRRSN